MRHDFTTSAGILAFIAAIKANPHKRMTRSQTNGQPSKQDQDRKNGVPESQFLYRRA